MVLWRGLYGTLKRVVWYFEEGGVVLWIGLHGTLKRVVWYFEEGCMVLWRGLYGTLKMVVWYFEEGGVVLWRGLHGTLKRVAWYFEEGGVVLRLIPCNILPIVEFLWRMNFRRMAIAYYCPVCSSIKYNITRILERIFYWSIQYLISSNKKLWGMNNYTRLPITYYDLVHKVRMIQSLCVHPLNITSLVLLTVTGDPTTELKLIINHKNKKRLNYTIRFCVECKVKKTKLKS